MTRYFILTVTLQKTDCIYRAIFSLPNLVFRLWIAMTEFSPFSWVMHSCQKRQICRAVAWKCGCDLYYWQNIIISIVYCPIFHICSAPSGCKKLVGRLKPIRNGEKFWKKIIGINIMMTILMIIYYFYVASLYCTWSNACYRQCI